MTRVQRHRQTPEHEVRKAFVVLVAHGGSWTRGARALTEGGTPMTESTLRGWAVDHFPELYAEVKAVEGPRLEEQFIDEGRVLALRGLEAQHDVYDRLRDPAAEHSPAQVSALASAASKFAISSGINVDKVQLLQGKPTQISAPSDPRQDLAALARALGLVKDSTAVEEPLPPQIEGPS